MPTRGHTSTNGNTHHKSVAVLTERHAHPAHLRTLCTHVVRGVCIYEYEPGLRTDLPSARRLAAQLPTPSRATRSRNAASSCSLQG
jgi:hypothetical protein